MKNPLWYQATKYDCGPTSVENAISFLFDREEIPPAILKRIMLYCLDQDSARGELSKGGTSSTAMRFVCNWLNQYHQVHKFPIRCEFITGSEVCIEKQSKIVRCLQNGGAVVLRVWFGCGHYMLLTGLDEHCAFAFDPYYREKPFGNKRILMIDDKPTCMNRKIPFDVLNSEGKGFYEMGRKEYRDATLIYNLNKIKTGQVISQEG